MVSNCGFSGKVMVVQARSVVSAIIHSTSASSDRVYTFSAFCVFGVKYIKMKQKLRAKTLSKLRYEDPDQTVTT